jgi:hypothetical protein
MNKLVSVLHRFRQYQYAVTGDVKEMFLQIRVPEDEKDYLCFLWYEKGKVYRYRCHLFGKCNSPCVAMAAIFLQVLKHKDEFPEAFETIAKASLVDDMADSRPSKDQIKELVYQPINFFPLCAMDIRTFVANSYDIMTDLKPEQRVKYLEDNEILKHFFKGQIPVTKIKILGLIWDYVLDYIKFNFTSVERLQRPITKLKMLQLLHSLYNPLGILIPFLIMAKLLIQNCCRIGLTWKDELPLQMEKDWFAWQEQIEQLGDIQIERTLILGEKPDNHYTQLHVFVDASQDV